MDKKVQQKGLLNKAADDSAAARAPLPSYTIVPGYSIYNKFSLIQEPPCHGQYIYIYIGLMCFYIVKQNINVKIEAIMLNTT